MLAGLTSVKELSIDKAEANALATSIANVSRHYDIVATQKTMDWSNLFMALGMVYGTRMYAIRARRQQARRSAPQPVQPQNSAQAGTVDIPGVGRVAVDQLN